MPDSPVTERMCKERHDNLAEKVDDIKDSVNKILLLWNGNGEVGAGEKINMLWNERGEKKQAGIDIWTGVIRAIIIALLMMILHRLGVH